MILPAAAWRDDPALARLVAALGGGEEVRAVGGAVRDTLLGLPVADLDLATVHPPEESRRRIAAAGFRAVPTGIAHGTVTAVLPGGPVEVTTLRRDVETDGRHARVAFTDSWREDAARRDFTINALFADPASGAVHDYFGGLDDLDRGLVRFIGEPLERIAEDHLRILRFFRFHARFGRGEPDAAALAACAARANDLMALSRERVAQEWLKLLATARPAATVRLMLDVGVLAPVLPEIDADGVERLAALEAIEPDGGAPIRRFAALLPSDPGLADRVGARLRLSNAQRKRLAAAVVSYAGEPPQRLAYAIGAEGARDRLLLAGRTEAAAELAEWIPAQLPISGGRLIELGLRPGPIVAATLARVRERWIDEGCPEDGRAEAIAAEETTRVLGTE